MVSSTYILRSFGLWQAPCRLNRVAARLRGGESLARIRAYERREMRPVSAESSAVQESITNTCIDGPRAGEKRYQWLKRALTGALDTDFSIPQPLPTEQELAAQFGVSRQTVRRALGEMAGDGMIDRVAGRGTFLLPLAQRSQTFTSSRDLFSSDPAATYELTTSLTRTVDISAAGRMRQPTDIVYSASFRRIEDGIVVGVTTVHLPQSWGELLMDVPDLQEAGRATRTSIIELLDHRLGGRVAVAEQSITATALSPLVAHRLGRRPEDIALQVDLMFFDARDDVIGLQSSFYLPDAFSYRITFRRAR